MSSTPWSIVPLPDGRFQVKLHEWLKLEELCGEMEGKVWSFDAESPAHVVEWKWPLNVAVAPVAGQGRFAAALQSQRENGPVWMGSITKTAHGECSDVLFVPSGARAADLLSRIAVPVTTDLVIVTDAKRGDWPRLAAEAERILRLTMAHALIVTEAGGADLGWWENLLRQISHDLPVDEAMAGSLGGSAVLFSTRMFLDRARLSGFLEPLKRRLEEMPPGRPLNLNTVPRLKAFLGARNKTGEVLKLLGGGVRYVSEKDGASVISEIAVATPAPVRRRRAAKPSPAEAKQERYLLERILPMEAVRLKPEEALEAGRKYALEVKVGPKEAGFGSGKESFPEPPVKPEESGVLLTVVFTEAHSCPAGQLRTILLPRTGASSSCTFEFAASGASNVFDGWISIYHNNRLLQEGELKVEVVGGAAGAQAPPAKAEFRIGAMPRPLTLGLEGRSPSAGTIRVEDTGAVGATRGYQSQRVVLNGLKTTVDAISAEFDMMDWESMGANWQTDASASKRLARIAQIGWQLKHTLAANPVVKEIAAGLDPIVIHAAGSELRVPFELCYDNAQPRSDAKICVHSGDALANGGCTASCGGAVKASSVICPLGFWGMKRVIEWHSEAADSRSPGEYQFSNEPTKERDTIEPLRSVVHARSNLVTPKLSKALKTALSKAAAASVEAASWSDWEEAVQSKRPTLLLLMPHVDHTQQPSRMEIRKEFKDPPGVEEHDVVATPPQQPLVLLLGCGASHAPIDFMSLPAQFRRNKAAIVIAPIAQLLADDAPEVARVFIESVAAGGGQARRAGEVLLDTKRRLLAEGRLSGLMLLATGDAEWLLK